MEYRIATKEDIGLLMSIRMEMLRKVNELSDNYVFSDEFIANSMLNSFMYRRNTKKLFNIRRFCNDISR